MSEGFLADAELIARVSAGLRAGSEELDGLAPSVPRVPDAGPVSG